ncbi:putative secreted protein (Por secretion system target) [Lacibacter cauensis]|uniref:Putative secreted protein (Por secretion system target) n=1 Tax=Lacibacter cauensis TaxID=510947 RepID=A0A562SFZ4_9BACT|nr:choice-of-anchor J domain-containing protein [Lacibacter cauensis]TWI79486.1 putative secreted protein (Por secretion system target) [Lacibacter cauensis]
MRKLQLQLLLCFLFLATGTLSGFSQVVISQVYGGGGNSGATYTHDFIELFNRGTSSVSLSGWSVQYASATGTAWTKTDLTNVTLAPGQYYLIQQAVGAGGTTALPTPDAIGTIAMSGTAGKVALLNTNTLITSGTSCPTGSNVQDFVGFGTTANCFEGSGSTPAPSNTLAVLRAASGCTDNNINSTDFATGTPTPRNTATSLNPCSGSVLSVSASAGINASEPATNGTFSITSSAPAPTGGILINYSLAGTATAGVDYSNASTGSVTIPAGSSSATVTINVLNDADIEAAETVLLTITSVSSPAVIGGATATINLLDDDVPAPGAILLSTSYAQNFNTLASTGTGLVWTNNSTIAGWYSSRTTYNSGTGSSNTGALYSFGDALSTERALGSVGSSGTGTVFYGARFKNNSGATITKLKITYKGEQWRNGGSGTSNTVNFAFQSSASALTSLTSGTWTPITDLNFTSPVTEASATALDGNATANSTGISYTIRNLNIAPNDEIMIRWEDIDHNGSDHGLAIDDFTIEANPVDLIPPTATMLSPLNGATNIAVNFTSSITFNEDVVKGSGNIILKKASDNSIVRTIAVNDAVLNGRTLSVNVTNLQVNTAYYFEVAAGVVTDLEGNPFAGITGSSTWAFTTGINIYVANFQNCSSALSDGFTQYSQLGSIVWACTPFGRDPNSTTASLANGVQINGFAGGTNVPNTDWLISPSFDLTATDYPLLSFWSRTAFNGQPLQLKVSTDYVSGDPSAATWTDINGKFPGQTSNVWTLSENINLSAFKGSNVHFAFVYVSDDDEGARWTLDDIALGNSPVPPPPSLTVSTTDMQFAFAAAGSTADKTFTLVGNDLTNDITLTATGAFGLSKDGVTFSSSVTYTVAEANNLFKTITVRFAPTQNNQNFTGSISINSGDLTAAISLGGSSIDPVTTLEVVNWNVEWFGSVDNGPTNNDQQQQNVKTILSNLNADVYALAEVVSEERLAAIVSQMPGYTYAISNYGSHTNTSANPPSALASAQKLAFIYKTSVLSNVSTTALLSQGINSAADLTNPAYNYWASGRFPYMLSADVTLNCVTKPVKFILVHAKANTSPTTESYNRRKRGADTLHYILQQNYANDNIIILGDYNDDLDQSITAGFTTTSYSIFTNDAANFTPVTLPLSLAGKKSTVSYNDVIDHVTVSNDLVTDYLPASAKILTDVTSLVSNYGSTTSDHYPVFSRYRFANTTAPAVTTCTAEVKFCAVENNTYSVPAFVATDDCGDALSYSYSISGATERSGIGNNASGVFNIGTSVIVWTATDDWGNQATCSTTVIVNSNPVVTIADAYALPTGTLPNTVYIGYAPASSITLTASASGGTTAYNYSWSSGSTAATTTVSPQTATVYTVTVTDANGCTATAEKAIDVLDIRSGKKLDKVTVCHLTGSGQHAISISKEDVADHLAHGDMLGSCIATQPSVASRIVPVSSALAVQVLPNPSTSVFTLLVSSQRTERIVVRVLDVQGRVLEQQINNGQNQPVKVGEGFRPGIYFAEIIQGNERKLIKLLKL